MVVDYLGHIVMSGKLLVAKKTVDAVQKFSVTEVPETQTLIT